jgi:hypothetical protein
MDSRHDYILSIVADKLDMKQDDVEEFMLDNFEVHAARITELASLIAEPNMGLRSSLGGGVKGGSARS